MKRAWTQRQLFIIGREVIASLSYEEVHETFLQMQELGIARFPTEEVAIDVESENFLRVIPKSGGEPTPVMGWRMRVVVKDRNPGFEFVDLLADKYKTNQFFSVLSWFGITELAASCKVSEMLGEILVVLLATRNVEKTTIHNKRAKLGIGKSEFRSTTTIKIGKVTEYSSSEATSRTVRAHLRRGHIRRQHYGPKNELIKKIFIEPVFVNADEEFISARTAYNISL